MNHHYREGMLSDLTAVELAILLRGRELSSVEVVEHFLERIASENSGAFVDVTPASAIERATALDSRPAAGSLHGMPIADKDLQLRAGARTTFGSRAFRDFIAPENDEVVDACESAGTVSLGKTASPEFGFAGYTSSLLHGHTTIPGHPGLGAGGSSGGAAAAVAARLLPFAPGSDAAGSIRIPAAACGVVGIKPSRGVALPVREGPMGDLPVPGALGRNVADAWLLLDGLFGGTFETTLRATADTGRPLRIGVLRGFHPWRPITDGEPCDEAGAAIAVAASRLKEAGHVVEDFVGPALQGYSDAFQTAWHASAAAMRPTDEQLELFEPLTAHFVRSGRSMPHGDVAAAQNRLDEFGSCIRDAFAPYDAVITHTTALTPRPVDWFTDDPEVNFRRQCEYAPHTSFVNVAGLPAVSLPVADLPDGLTMSVQIIGRHAEDRLVVATAAQLERMSQ